MPKSESGQSVIDVFSNIMFTRAYMCIYGEESISLSVMVHISVHAIYVLVSLVSPRSLQLQFSAIASKIGLNWKYAEIIFLEFRKFITEKSGNFVRLKRWEPCTD